jgi:hypothetical protein
MGPPTAPLMSYSFFSESVTVAPLDLRRSVTLLPWRPGQEPLIRNEPRNVLPPDFGMAFISTPLVPDSASWPEKEMFTSS